MTDICEISRAKECIEAGEHEPLQLPGSEYTSMHMKHTSTGRNFAEIIFCKRCGLLYWQPLVTKED